jgi:hypothetical protein
MSALDRWNEHLQERDAICAAILDLASVVRVHSVTDQRVQLDPDLDDQALCDARDRLAQLIEDPALATAITHAIRRLWRRWEEEHYAIMAKSSNLPFGRSIVQRLCKRLSHAASKDETQQARI